MSCSDFAILFLKPCPRAQIDSACTFWFSTQTASSYRFPALEIQLLPSNSGYCCSLVKPLLLDLDSASERRGSFQWSTLHQACCRLVESWKKKFRAENWEQKFRQKKEKEQPQCKKSVQATTSLSAGSAVWTETETYLRTRSVTISQNLNMKSKVDAS